MAGKTTPELDVLAAPVADADVLTAYRAPGPLKRTTAAVFADYIKAFFSASGGSALIGFLQAGTGASARTAQAKMRDVVNALDFGAVQNGTTQQAIVQAAVSATPAKSLLYIPSNVKFSLNALTLPQNINIDFCVDDCTDTPGTAAALGSGERILFSNNSSFPTFGTGGLVNEWRFTSGYASGVVADTWTTIAGVNPYLGPGQSRTNPVRVSFNWHIDEVGQAYSAVVRYPTFNNFTGWGFHTWRRTIELNGVGTAAWSSVPAENTLITGTTSGATGLLLSTTAGSTTVLWISGRFSVGETLTDDNETTSATISSVTNTATACQPLSQDLKRGNWSVGVPPGAPRNLFTVGGKIAATKTRSFSQHIDEAVTNPAYMWVDDYEAATPAGMEVTYNVTPAAASRRLTTNRMGIATPIGMVGASTMFTNFSNSALLATSRFNVASVTRTTTGDYSVTATNAFARSDYTIGMAKHAAGDNPYVFINTTSVCRIQNDDRNFIWSGTATYDPASLADGAGVNTTVTVTGISASAQCWATFSVALSGVEIRAWWSAADTVTVRFQNNTGAPVDLASGTITAYGRGSGALKDLTGQIHVACVGGDI